MSQTDRELTFQEQQHITEVLEGYRTNPSNSNKFRFELFAYIDELFALNRAALKQELKQSLEAQMPKDKSIDIEIQDTLHRNIGFNEANKLNREAIDAVFQDKGDK